MSKKKSNANQVPADRHPLHPERKLVTRRDFLSTGALSFGGMVMVPSVLEMTLFARAARAGTCADTAIAGMPPLLIFDCAGGAALPGNWVPMDKGGQPLANYSNLGLATPNSWTLDNRFGAQMAGPLPPPQTTTIQSNIFAQLSMLDPNLQRCIQMGTIPATSMSDSQSNTFSPLSLVTAAGLVGSKVQTGLGMTSAQSGGNSDCGSFNPSHKPMQIKSADALAAALSYGPAFKALPQGVLDTLASTLMKLSGTQAQRFNNMTLGQQFTQLMQAGYLKNQGYTAGVAGIDPRVDPDCQRIYNIMANTSGSDGGVVFATLALNAIMGNSGPAVLTIGGCDYHDGTQTSGDGKDTEIGKTMAQALQLAYAKGQKITFIVYTDGGIYSDPGVRNWRGDDNQHGMAIFGVMDPKGKPTMAKTQVGWYNDAQVTDPKLNVNNNPLMVCHSLFLNYLAVAGMADRYADIIACQDQRNTTLLPNLYSGSTTAMLNDLLLFPNGKKG